MNNISLKKRICSRVAVTLLLLAIAPALFGAQPVVPPPIGAAPDATPAWSEQESSNNEMQVFIPATAAKRASTQPFVLGPVIFRPHVNYDLTYATGLQNNTNISGTNNIGKPPTNSFDSIIQTLSPGMTLDIGRHLTLDYTPTLTFYSDKHFKNTLNHAASLNAATDYGDWGLGLNQSFSLSSAPLAETAQQTETTDYKTTASGTYTINEQMYTELELDQDLNYVTGFEDSKTWSTMDWLNYSFWTRLSVGVGAGLGYISLSNDQPVRGQPEPGDQQFETLQAKVNWRATDKLSLAVNGGLQIQEYDAAVSPAVTSVNPVFGASIQYQPFKHTQLSLSANRTINPSDYNTQSQSQITSSVLLSLNQRLLEKFYLDLSGGYTENQFSQPSQASVNNRTDNSYSFSARLSRNFLKHGNVSLHYQYSDNLSSTAGFTYHSSQVGVEVNYSY